MLDRDAWSEVFATIGKNKLRSLLTGFSVAWGIFMLLVLLGSGTGLRNGIEYQFRDDATNSIWVRGGQTSLPWQGTRPGRTVTFTNEDYAELRDRVSGIDHITGRFWIQGRLTVAYKKESGNFDIRSVHPDHRYLEKTIVASGRFINDLDLALCRKVASIGVRVRDALFHGEEPLGSLIRINGIAFEVVGVFDDEGGENEQEKIYLPITTAQRVFNGQNRIQALLVTVGDAGVEESERMAAEIRRRLATNHHFSTEDKRAISVSNSVVEFKRYTDLMKGIRMFVWAIGIGTLLAGVVSVSNIMLITVRDRTKEIGVRKALGATPASIVGLVLQESIFITGLAGLVGLLFGLAVLQLGASFVPATSEYFRNPSVDFNTALEATLLLVLAGAVAGFVPARRAAAIRPIEALRDE